MLLMGGKLQMRATNKSVDQAKVCADDSSQHYFQGKLQFLCISKSEAHGESIRALMFSTLVILLCISSNLLRFLSNHQRLCASATSKLACPCPTKDLTNLEPSELWPQRQLPTEQNRPLHPLPQLQRGRSGTAQRAKWHRITGGDTVTYTASVVSKW